MDAKGKAKDKTDKADDTAPDQAPDQDDKPAKAAAPARPKAADLIPEAGKRTDDRSIDILLDACDRYGVNPEKTARPRELAAWRYYPGEPLDGIPDSIVLVTQGGLKIKHFSDPTYPMDPETEERLRNLFRAFKVDPVTKQPMAAPLPDELTLPAEAVTGLVTSDRHVYRRGYLREGGKEEGNRRAARG